MTESALLTSWAASGILAAAARFLPLPLVDDAVRQGAARIAVAVTLRAHPRPYPVSALAPLWEEVGGSRRRRVLRALSTKLLLFPVRKYAAVFGAVRGVPTDVLRVVLLGRTLERALVAGRLQEPVRLEQEARDLRRAFDRALADTDLGLIVAAVGEALSRTRGLTAAAVAQARRRLTRRDDPSEVDAPVAEGAQRVTEALDTPEVSSALARFDAQVDRLLTPR